MAVKNNYISVAYQLYVKDGESEKEEFSLSCFLASLTHTKSKKRIERT